MQKSKYNLWHMLDMWSLLDVKFTSNYMPLASWVTTLLTSAQVWWLLDHQTAYLRNKIISGSLTDSSSIHSDTLNIKCTGCLKKIFTTFECWWETDSWSTAQWCTHWNYKGSMCTPLVMRTISRSQSSSCQVRSNITSQPSAVNVVLDKIP